MRFPHTGQQQTGIAFAVSTDGVELFNMSVSGKDWLRNEESLFRNSELTSLKFPCKFRGGLYTLISSLSKETYSALA